MPVVYLQHVPEAENSQEQASTLILFDEQRPKQTIERLVSW